MSGTPHQALHARPTRPAHVHRPSPRTVRAAKQVCARAAPWREARRWPGLQVTDRQALAGKVGRRLSHLELAAFSIVRRAALTHPGVQVSVAQLARKLDRGWRQTYRVLDSLGDHHAACSGLCRRPGRDKLGRLLCRDCARPCAPDCTEHANLIRRVHQFVELTWQANGRTFKRQQCASVLLLGTAARVPRRAGKVETPPVRNDTLKPSSPPERGRGEEGVRDQDPIGRGSEPPVGGGSIEACSQVARMEVTAIATTSPPLATPEAPEGQGGGFDFTALLPALERALATPQPPQQVEYSPARPPLCADPEAPVTELPPEIARLRQPTRDELREAKRAALAALKAWRDERGLPPLELGRLVVPEQDALDRWEALETRPVAPRGATSHDATLHDVAPRCTTPRGDGGAL